MIFVQMGQHKEIHAAPAAGQEIAAGNITGTVGSHNTAAVNHERFISGKNSDRLPLADIDNGKYTRISIIAYFCTGQKKSEGNNGECKRIEKLFSCADGEEKKQQEENIGSCDPIYGKSLHV